MKKYIPVFGPQELFNSASDDAVIAIKDTTSGRIHFFTDEGWIKAGLKHERHIGTSDNQIAMRRIIKTPVWTVADQQAGRLPEVGCVVMVIDVNEVARIAAINNDSVCSVCVVFEDGGFSTLHFSGIAPIETPEEKAQRERDEWIDNACSFICFYDIGRVDAIKSLEITYDKLKSGELPMPKKDGE